MGVQEYRLSEPPAWSLRVLAAAILGMAVSVWFVLPTTLEGGTAPLVPALALEATFLVGVVAAFRTTPEELQDGIIVVVAAGAAVVTLYVLAQGAIDRPFEDPLTRGLLSLLVGVGGGLIAALPAFGKHVFVGDAERLGSPE